MSNININEGTKYEGLFLNKEICWLFFNFLGAWVYSGWIWTRSIQSCTSHLVCYTHTSPTSIFLKLTLSFLLLPPQKFPGSCGVVGFVWPQHCPVFITPLTGYPGPPRTCAAPRSLQECAGACNRLCGGHWVVWLTETSQPHSALGAEWGSAWGGSPNYGRCQIPTVAPHNHSHTGPDIPPGGKGWGGSGCGGERARWAVQRNGKKSYNSKQDGRFLCHFGTLEWRFS